MAALYCNLQNGVDGCRRMGKQFDIATTVITRLIKTIGNAQ